ncbi:FCD domain-containing protein [Duganella sp. FT92W]|uniref:FCD domain-containing protein n=2 Tax=Pseudoduganella rivuli TaxID=2666085 RepID=A0A7X2II97_9BURK|nr:FCD domain-containing protein [Pseudoduganella rivuli]
MDLSLLEGTFDLAKGPSASTQIYDYLRAKIVSLEFTPGTVLPRPELARFFNVSVTPVRDALLRLEEEGLVDIFPQHATRVREVDLDSARHAQFLRLALELEVARTLASQEDSSVPARLRQLVETQRSCWARKDVEGFIAADQEFHRHLFTAANAERLWHTLRARSGNMDRLRRLHLPLNNKAESVLRQHAELVDAIEQRDPALAEDRVRRHLGGTLSQLNDLRNTYPQYLKE